MTVEAMVELNKSESGTEDCILAHNTLTHEDAIRAIAMLKAKIVGEWIQPAESKWTSEVKLRNLRTIEQYTGQTIDRSARKRSLPDEVERR